jgi:exodeoxyribonuclease-3
MTPYVSSPMLKVTTWNVNGVRARERELTEFIERERPDILCLQEVKAAPEQLPETLARLEGHHFYWHGQKGYSGVALHVSQATFPRPPVYSHPEFDHESRVVAAEFGDVVFASVYVPNGGKDFNAKVKFLDAMGEWTASLQKAGKALVLVGDLNVAREVRDVHAKLRKPDQIGTTSGERAQLERVISHGLVDLARKFHPDDDALFTWWAPWRNMREKNVGWRIDYVLAHESLAARAVSCEVDRTFGASDHGPLTAVFDMAPPEPTGEPSPPKPPPVAPPPTGQQSLF